jgi:regulator of protease activity HflC (stomatin/prohibitin superfamily)
MSTAGPAGLEAVPLEPRDGPVVQSIRIGFGFFRLATLLLAAFWCAGNIHPVPPGSQAVVLLLGRIVRVQPAGLVLAWPRPLEQVVLLPSAERQMSQKIEAHTSQMAGVSDDPRMADVPRDAGVFLTADNSVVLLDAAVTWHIADARAYYVMQAHVAPALRRLFMAAAVAVAARHELDDFLAVRPERATDPAAQAARGALRGELVAEMNRSLGALAGAGEGLGVEVTRADVTALLPPSAKSSFDAVLEAAQQADQGAAAARTEAARTMQQATRDSTRILDSAHAAAAERLAQARTTTATISALEAKMDPGSRPALLEQAYRDRVASVLHQAGSLSMVDARSNGRVIVSGAGQ